MRFCDHVDANNRLEVFIFKFDDTQAFWAEIDDSIRINIVVHSTKIRLVRVFAILYQGRVSHGVFVEHGCYPF